MYLTMALKKWVARDTALMVLAIDFIPYEEMDEKGYSEFKKFVK